MTTKQSPQKKEGWGVVGVISGELARYSHFSVAMLHLQLPDGTKLGWDPGANITGQSNKLVEITRKMEAQWLWIIGDDHVFPPNIVLRLLAHDVDVIVPNCLQRSSPFNPVVYEGLVDGHHKVLLDPPAPGNGITEIYAAGSAGMLVRRHVLESLPERPFQTTGGHQNEDLEFCARVREAGFKIWLDAETPLAHVGTMVVWPQWLGEEAGWGAALTLGPDIDGVPQKMPIKRVGGTRLTAA